MFQVCPTSVQHISCSVYERTRVDSIAEDTAVPPPIHIKNTRKPRHQTILDWPSPQEPNFPRTPNGGFAHFNVAYRSPPPLTATHPIPPTPDKVALSPTDTARFSIMNAPPSSPPGLSTYATFAAASSRTLVLVNGDLSRASSALPTSRQDDEERRARSVNPVDVNLVYMRSGRVSVVGSPQAIGH